MKIDLWDLTGERFLLTSHHNLKNMLGNLVASERKLLNWRALSRRYLSIPLETEQVVMNLSPEAEKLSSLSYLLKAEKRWTCISLRLPQSAGSALGRSSWLACFWYLGGTIPFMSWKGKKLSLLTPSLRGSQIQRYVGRIAGTPLLPQSPLAAITQLSTIYWNNRLFILNLTSNMIMVSFYIYTVLFIPEDPKMFQLLMGSSCLIVDSTTAQQCRAEAKKSSASNRSYRGIYTGETELPKLQFSQDAWG